MRFFSFYFLCYVFEIRRAFYTYNTSQFRLTTFQSLTATGGSWPLYLEEGGSCLESDQERGQEIYLTSTEGMK